MKEIKSTRSLLESLSNLLRYESADGSPQTSFFNPWRLSLTQIFPKISFQSLENISSLFTPTSTRFLFVRHPFARLASAYRERIATLPNQRIEPEPYYDGIRRLICVRYLNFYRIHPSWSHITQCNNTIPIFQHFVEYILSNAMTPIGIDRMDSHWKPYSVICQVCKFKYNFIGRQESFKDDFGLLLKRFNISGWNVEKRRGSSGFNRTTYQELYASLSDELICLLRKLYKDDFELFNYRVEDYANRTNLTCS